MLCSKRAYFSAIIIFNRALLKAHAGFRPPDRLSKTPTSIHEETSKTQFSYISVNQDLFWILKLKQEMRKPH